MSLARASLFASIALACVTAFAAASSTPGGGKTCRALGATAAFTDEYYAEVYFGALEGLYADGVSNEVVDSLLVFNDAGGHALFVSGCLICLPVLNALRTYRARPEHVGFKEPFDTFGAGLAEAEVQACTSADLDVRYKALGAMVERWVDARLAARRLSAEERQAFEREMEVRRKKGMAGLAPQTVGGKDATFEACASCDAANAASRWR